MIFLPLNPCYMETNPVEKTDNSQQNVHIETVNFHYHYSNLNDQILRSQESMKYLDLVLL
jgi:hypothetical protein